MLTNYLKIAWRNLYKNRTYGLINVAGLALGMGCALLLFALIRSHYQTDQHHRNYDRIYQFTSRFRSTEGDFNIRGVPYAFGRALRTDHPNLEQVAMVDEWYAPMLSIPVANKADKKIKDGQHMGAFAEPAFFRIFDYTWLSGGPEALQQPGTIVMSREMAIRCFGTATGVIGKTVRLNARTPARVVGVFADYQDNTDLAYSVVASWASLTQQRGSRPEDDRFDNTNGSTHCYALFGNRFTPTDWNQELPSFVKKYNPEQAKGTSYPAVAFSAMHLSPEYGGVSRGLLLSLLTIGLLLIGTASINFVNLATAQALNRAREVGVRKVLGSTQSQLFWQFMGETAVIVIVATGLALGLFQYGQTLVHQYMHGPFRFTFYFSPSVLVGLPLLVLSVIGLSGLYPALVMAGFRPVVALAGRFTKQQAGGFSVRRGLVVAQFAISQLLIIGLVVITNQLTYVQQKDLGFRKDAVLTVRLPDVPAQDRSKLNAFRHRAMALPDVAGFSYSMGGAPQSGWISQTIVWFDNRPNKEPYAPQQTWVDADYVGLYGLKLVAGRNLHPSDTARETLINETFMHRLGIRQPEKALGKFIRKGGMGPLEIVGILKDYNQSDLKESITPLFMTTLAEGYGSANIQLRSANFAQTLKQLESAYNQIYTDSFFEPAFVDEQIGSAYQREQTMSLLINVFAGVALFIGGMGLYGLVLFMVAQKTKEVGIRKVLGASSGSILWLFSREFVRLLVVAFVVATPVAWWVMDGWLQSFQYRISLSPVIFLIALLATLVVALLTVGFQSIKAALMNPVKSLRSE
ncbi:FtsX-like permease family protein [Spirosoma sp.]|uniref:FtsX-like permease family protein n=1 Tax=Spirosoma sp. TaxID=1899569 RepID=UPI002635C8F7|nr:FtsX-like permease family protein [Spirosoma sp.]MCX6214284.1 ABC transporter permease [Spirosoma sp.]